MNDPMTPAEEYITTMSQTVFYHLVSIFAKRYPEECKVLTMGGAEISASVRYQMVETLYLTIAILIDGLDNNLVLGQFENFKINLQKILIYDNKVEKL